MGRGRQKAKQTKVARELKYFSPQTDYHQLERELRGETASTDSAVEDRWATPEDDDYDKYDYSAWEDLAGTTTAAEA